MKELEPHLPLMNATFEPILPLEADPAG
jgi:hypothetical protein